MTEESELLTGDWLGTYYYPRTLEPVAFEASLIEFDGILTGTTSEVFPLPSHGERKIQGHLDGERSGDAVRFSKVYVGASGPHRREIFYAGTIWDRSTRIEGTWTLANSWSGVFKMTRIRQKQASFRRRLFEEIKA
ncbi:hypothetical protein [Labrys monachus]|uniref:Uncharacterized protein n=1 Tax=Labrys monachus TaxID=217067 RepID=A0ABU0FEX8_9HYPH|nr:hypothetical protein [Labrys monachus]MDQ0392658.1 hypothetical protein [Labrys monachus]